MTASGVPVTPTSGGIFEALGLTAEQVAEVEAEYRAEMNAIAESERQAWINTRDVIIR